MKNKSIKIYVLAVIAFCASVVSGMAQEKQVVRQFDGLVDEIMEDKALMEAYDEIYMDFVTNLALYTRDMEEGDLKDYYNESNVIGEVMNGNLVAHKPLQAYITKLYNNHEELRKLPAVSQLQVLHEVQERRLAAPGNLPKLGTFGCLKSCLGAALKTYSTWTVVLFNACFVAGAAGIVVGDVVSDGALIAADEALIMSLLRGCAWITGIQGSGVAGKVYDCATKNGYYGADQRCVK